MSARAAASLAIFPRPTRAASPTPVSSFRCGPASLHLHGNLQQLRSRPASLILFAAKSENGASTDANREEPEKVDKRAKPFSNTNKFLVPESCQFQFELEWKEREKNMNLYTGFNGLKITREGNNYTVTSSWATAYDWEDWATGSHHRRSHLPLGIWQYPVEKGKGFPETFVPLIGLTDKPMLAQY